MMIVLRPLCCNLHTSWEQLMVTSLTDIVIMEAPGFDTVITTREWVAMHGRGNGKSILAARHHPWLTVTRPSAHYSCPFWGPVSAALQWSLCRLCSRPGPVSRLCLSPGPRLSAARPPQSHRGPSPGSHLTSSGSCNVQWNQIRCYVTIVFIFLMTLWALNNSVWC